MLNLQSRYIWEAEKADGRIVRADSPRTPDLLADPLWQKGELSDCVRLSLVPSVPYLPRHSLAGVPMVRRFCRAFRRVRFNDYLLLPGFLSWESGSRIVRTSEDIRALVAPGQMIKKRHDSEKWWPVIAVGEGIITLARPYDGKTKRIESKRLVPKPSSEYAHCIVCTGFRLYVLSTDGRALVTPEDYELYL